MDLLGEMFVVGRWKCDIDFRTRVSMQEKSLFQSMCRS